MRFININNLNDNTPTLSGGPYAIDENSPNGTSVGTLTSNDADGDALTFTITAGNIGGAFDINSPSGEFVVANSDEVNFETNSTFNLTVQADDGANTNTTGVTINLNNINDAPEFTSDPDTYVAKGAGYTYTVTTADDDGDPVTLSGVTIPTWLTFTPATGVLAGTAPGT